MSKSIAIPAVSVTYAQAGTSTTSNALGMRPMQERAYQKRGEAAIEKIKDETTDQFQYDPSTASLIGLKTLI
jgi:hypothetical protein